MITAISSSNSNKRSFAANPVEVAEKGIKAGEQLAEKAADSFENAVPKGLTPNSPLHAYKDKTNYARNLGLFGAVMLYITTHHS